MPRCIEQRVLLIQSREVVIGLAATAGLIPVGGVRYFLTKDPSVVEPKAENGTVKDLLNEDGTSGARRKPYVYPHGHADEASSLLPHT